jgi:hypothetical protein
MGHPLIRRPLKYKANLPPKGVILLFDDSEAAESFKLIVEEAGQPTINLSDWADLIPLKPPDGEWYAIILESPDNVALAQMAQDLFRCWDRTAYRLRMILTPIPEGYVFNRDGKVGVFDSYSFKRTLHTYYEMPSLLCSDLELMAIAHTRTTSSVPVYEKTVVAKAPNTDWIPFPGNGPTLVRPFLRECSGSLEECVRIIESEANAVLVRCVTCPKCNMDAFRVRERPVLGTPVEAECPRCGGRVNLTSGLSVDEIDDDPVKCGGCGKDEFDIAVGLEYPAARKSDYPNGEIDWAQEGVTDETVTWIWIATRCRNCGTSELIASVETG